MGRRLLRLTLLLTLLAALVLTACGDDDEDDGERPATQASEQQTESTETSPSAQREALKDTTQRPVIPRPAGSPPRKLVTEDVVKGKGRAAKPGDTVTVQYSGATFSTGEEFDSSWDSGQPFTFPLGGGQVIEGWDKGLVGIKEGGRRMLTIPPEQGYGAEGSPPAIGPNETLVFVVDAVEIR